MLFLLFILPLILLLAYTEFKNAKLKKILDHTPTLPMLPILGNAHQIGKTPHEVINFCFRLLYDFDHKNVSVWLAWHCYMMIFDLKDVEFILSSTTLLAKNNVYDLLRPWLGMGLLTSTGDRWRKHRKMITPSFHFKILQDFHDVINSNSSKFVEKLKVVSRGDNIFDIQSISSYVTLDIICETAMGVSVNAMDDPESKFASSLKLLCDGIIKRAVNPFKRIDITYRLFPDSKQFYSALKDIEEFTYGVIEKRVQLRKLEQAQDTNVGMDDTYIKRKVAFLDTLLMSTVDGRPLTRREIYEEVSTFMFEGHDTTTSAIAFTVFLLSRHQGVQKKVLDEQKQILGEGILKRDATYQELCEMKYLDMVVKESQRLYPSVPMIGRHTEKEYNMNGKIIPANTTLGIFLMGLGYNEKIFPDPYRFKPERFGITDSKVAYNPFAFIPFSAGPRNCIGQKFAQQEVKTIISKIVRNFEILPAVDELESKDGYVTSIYGPESEKRPKPHKYDPRLSTLLTLKSDNGVHVRLRERP